MKGKRLTAAARGNARPDGRRRRNRRRHRRVLVPPSTTAPSARSPRALHDQRPEERDLPARRRHGHPGDHRRPLLPGRQQRAQRRPDAVHRLRHHLVGEAGRQRRPTCPTTTPTRPRPGRCGRPGRRRSTSASPRARAAPINVPGQNLKTVLELAQKTRHEGRRRLDRRDHRRDAGGARLAHLAARLPGPGRHGRLPAGDQGAPAASARSPSRRSTTRSTCCSAAAAAASRRRSPAAPTPARRWSSRPRRKGYRYVTDAAGLSTVAERATSRCSACSTPATCRSSGPARPPRPARATPPVACTEGQRPASEPSLAAMTKQGDRPARRRQPQGVLPPGRGRLDRQAGPRHQRLRPDRRDGRLRPGDRRRARLPGRPPRHAGRRHRRPLAHQPDRRRGRRAARGLPDRLLDQPADQGRADAEPDLRHRRLRRPGRGAGRGAAEPAAHRRGRAGLGQRPGLARRARDQRPHRPVRDAGRLSRDAEGPGTGPHSLAG